MVPNIQIKGFNEAAVQTPTTKQKSIFFLVILFIERTSILVNDNGRSIKTNEFHKSTFGLHSHALAMCDVTTIVISVDKCLLIAIVLPETTI